MFSPWYLLYGKYRAGQADHQINKWCRLRWTTRRELIQLYRALDSPVTSHTASAHEMDALRVKYICVGLICIIHSHHRDYI